MPSARGGPVSAERSPSMDSRRELGIASGAALAATLGDLLMLFVGNSLRPELQLPRPPGIALPIGGLLGVAAIPLYALGYRAVARAIGRSSRAQARVVFVSGSAAAILGALIHGMTAVSLGRAVAGGAAARAPLETIAAEGGSLLAAWGVASLLVLLASLAVFVAGTSRARALPRHLGWLNPAALTLLFGAAGLPWELGRAFLLPAAPNLAHAAFFFSALRALGRTPRAP